MVIVVCGPIASGKSTVTRAVAQRFDGQGSAAAAIDLDLVYEMLDLRGAAKASATTWRRARRVAAGLTDVLLQEGVKVVVVEGDFLLKEERVEFVAALRSAVRPDFVTVKVPLEVALKRVREDPTRGISRDPDFLRRHYQELREAIRSRPSSDLVIDTSTVSIDEAARTIERWATGRERA